MRSYDSARAFADGRYQHRSSMSEREFTDFAAIDPSLQTFRVNVRLLPFRRGVTRRLTLIRHMTSLANRVRGLHGVEVVHLSPTASVRVHRPRGLAGTLPAVLWIHGGGYVLGSAATDDRAANTMAQELGATVACVEYRLAPEHPYPAALDDCFAVLEWLAALPEVDSRRIVVAGASAGGGLAAALTLRWVDSARVRLAGQVLAYPMLDDRSVRRIRGPVARTWTHEDNEFAWRSYLGCEPGTDGVTAYAAPARRENVAGLPPTWIGVGSADMFHDEDIDYANRLRNAGVVTRLEIVPGAFHGFDEVAPWTQLAQRFIRNRLNAMRQFLMPQ